QGVICLGCSSSVLVLENNILWANLKAIYSSGAFTESHNLYWSSSGSPMVQGFTMSPTSTMTNNPAFLSPGSNYHLTSASWAINNGGNDAILAGFTTDLSSL